MDRIRDLRGRTDHELLTSGSGGLFDTQYLDGEPPAATLREDERPRFALRNKKAGVTITGQEDEEELIPGSDYQALAVVTDCRLVFLVGDAGGDSVESVPLDEIVEASGESSGFMKSALVVETVDGTVWRFPVRGDVSEVATFVDGAAQTWANARRLADEASERVTESREALERGEFDRARAVLSDVADTVETARTRVETLGDGAVQALARRTSQLLDRLRQLEREIAAEKGAHHHAAAQSAWKRDHDFERAAAEYETAVTEYERALGADGSVPADEALQLRLKGALGEREVLRAAPLADAQAAREVAMATEDPDEAAPEWETALTCYREAVALDWGEPERSFITDRDHAEERASEAATEALDARVAAGEDWMAAGDNIVQNGDRQQAEQAYDRAREHFRRARDIARELAPERLEELREQLTRVDERQSGDVVPTAEAAESTLSVDAVAAKLDRTETGGGTPAQERHEATEPTPAIQRVDVGDAHAVESRTTKTEPDEPEVESPENVEAAITARETVPVEEGEESAAAPADGTGAETDTEPATATEEGATEPSDEDLAEALRELDEGALTDLVAAVWERRGWSATVFSSTTKTVYDVVAMREEGDERLLLWTVHRPDGGALGATVVRRCATTRDSSQGADSATLVTSGTLTGAARDRAEELDVTVVDCEGLVEAIRETGLTGELP